MDANTRHQRRIVALLLFGLAVEEMFLYPKSLLASCVEAVVLFGLFYWLVAVND
jgi:hypothetical protein